MCDRNGRSLYKQVGWSVAIRARLLCASQLLDLLSIFPENPMKAILASAIVALSLTISAATNAQAPSGSTGECKDGTYTSSESKRGACAAHGGVKDWYGTSAPAKSGSVPSTSAAAKSSAPVAAAAAPSGSTGQCKDGTYTSAESKKGACGGHGGVKNWYGSSTSTNSSAAAAPAKSPMAASPTPTTPTTKGPATSMPTVAAAGGGAGQVWVNSASKVYHCPGDKWYGKTKQGEYMTEAAAKAAGNHADHGKACS